MIKVIVNDFFEDVAKQSFDLGRHDAVMLMFENAERFVVCREAVSPMVIDTTVITFFEALMGDKRTEFSTGDIPAALEESGAPAHYTAIEVNASEQQFSGYLFLLFSDGEVAADENHQIQRSIGRELSLRIELSLKEQQLLESQQIYQLLTEGNPDLIFAKDADYKIIFANEALMSLYPEEKRDKVIGYTTVEEYDDEDAQAFLAQDTIALESGFSETLEKIVFPDGTTRILHTTKKRFFDLNKKAYILGVARDVTERETLINRLEESNRELEQLAYVASHDLKSPLSAIKRLSTWVIEDCIDVLPEESQQHLKLITGRCERMSMLLDDLLSYSKVDRKVYDCEEINLPLLVEELANLWDAPQTFKVEVDEAQLYLPKTPLSSILVNLVSNAIKHHDKPDGAVHVSSEKSISHYVITVSDDGPGIPEKLREKAFGMFQTLKPRDEVEGSGLGLSMVKKLIESYNGSVELENNQQGGCTFTIKWPHDKAG